MHIEVVSCYGNEMADSAVEDLVNFCKLAEKDTRQPAHENMSTVGWESKSNTLLHTIFKQGRYDRGRGCWFMGYVDGQLAGVSGCYTYEKNPEVLVCGVRCWTLPNYRVKYLHGNHIFPQQFEWGKANGYAAGMFTFNDYNLPLMNFLKRISAGKMTAPGLPNSDTYKDLMFLSEKKIIKNVAQWVAIKPFEEIEIV